jgi:hypothetical protein
MIGCKREYCIDKTNVMSNVGSRLSQQYRLWRARHLIVGLCLKFTNHFYNDVYNAFMKTTYLHVTNTQLNRLLKHRFSVGEYDADDRDETQLLWRGVDDRHANLSQLQRHRYPTLLHQLKVAACKRIG